MMRFGSFLLPLIWVAWGCGTRKQVSVAPAKTADTASLREIYYAAEFHYIQGNWKQSDSLFRRYVRSNISPGPAYHRLACIAAKNGRNDEALALNAKARLADTTVEDWIWLDADLHRRMYEYKKAGEVFSAYTIKHPRSWSVYNDAARCFAMAGEWSDVLNICARWEKSFGLMEDIVEYRVQAFTGLEEPEKAAEQWAALYRKYPDRSFYRYKQVNTLKESGAIKAASDLLDTMLAQNPRDYEMIALKCELNATIYDTAVPPYLLQIAQTKALSFESKWKCIETFAIPNHPVYDSCGALLRELVKMHPKEPELLNSLGLWCLFHGKAADAAAYLKQTLNEGKQNLITWQLYMTALSAGCEISEMLAESDTLLELYAMVPESYYIKGISSFLNGKTDEAQIACNQGKLYAESHTPISALQSYIQMQTGKAIQKPEMALLYEDSIINTDAVMVMAEWAILQRNWDAAAGLLNRLFANPITITAARNSAYKKDNYWSFLQCVMQQARLALITQKNQDAAIDLLRTFLSESPPAIELMGDLYGERSSLAQACYEKAFLCSSYIHRDRIQQKINTLKNR